MEAQSTISGYLNNLWAGVSSTLIGMGVTIRYFFSKTVTFQYPEEKMPIAPRYRGIHFLEQDLCIACRICEKACPIDCIEIRFTRQPGNINQWFEFSLDYNKCMFCELCVYPCPVVCIHMGKEFNLVKYDRNELVLDLLTWKGLRGVDETAIQKAKDDKAKKALEAVAKKAARAAAADKKKADAEKLEAENKGD